VALPAGNLRSSPGVRMPRRFSISARACREGPAGISSAPRPLFPRVQGQSLSKAIAVEVLGRIAADQAPRPGIVAMVKAAAGE
jgi:hypothetical protein